MMTLDEIKKLMAAGETAEADKALKELLEKEPNNLHAKMLYGTCRQLLGDEETFRRIHDELAPRMGVLTDGLAAAEMKDSPEELSLWQKYHALWMSLIVGGLVLAGVRAGVGFFEKDILNMFDSASRALSAYAGPEYPENDRQQRFLYGGPRYYEKDFIKTPEEYPATNL